MERYDFFILAAEPSADIHGAEIVKALLEKKPTLKIAAVAGPCMRKYPIDVIFPMEQFLVMGFIDVLLSLPRMIPLFFKVRERILSLDPRVVVFIDYPGFNLRMAHHLKQKNFKGFIAQYVCPTVWAWKKHRIPLMEKSLDLLIPLFPFEKDCFATTSLKVEFLGHPLANKTHPFLLNETKKNYLTLFPGSRKKEIIRNLGSQLVVGKKLAEKHNLKLAVVCAHPDFDTLISSIAKDIKQIPFDQRYEQMQKTKLAIAKSGTITLELSLMQVPSVVNFAINPFDQWLATKVFKINLPFYCIVNILLKKEVFPEFFGSEMKEESLFRAGDHILSNETRYQSILKDCQHIKEILSVENSKEKIANSLLGSFHLQKV